MTCQPGFLNHHDVYLIMSDFAFLARIASFSGTGMGCEAFSSGQQRGGPGQRFYSPVLNFYLVDKFEKIHTVKTACIAAGSVGWQDVVAASTVVTKNFC